MTVFALTPHQTVIFFVMKRHFLNLLRIFSGVNTAILLIYGPILGLTLQTRYVIKRSGISVKSYGVARWVRQIWTTQQQLMGFSIIVNQAMRNIELWY